MAWLASRIGANTAVFEGTPPGRRGVSAWPHAIGDGRHETERNHALIADIAGPFDLSARPRLRPGRRHEAAAEAWPEGGVILAPASVWETKRWPANHWARLADAIAQRWPERPILLLGGPSDAPLLESVRARCHQAAPWVCAGDLNLLGSSALMARSAVVVSNDSAPLHMAERWSVRSWGCSAARRRPSAACPEIGRPVVVWRWKRESLACKPCGLHGHRRCRKHTSGWGDLSVEQVLDAVGRVSGLP